MHSNFLYFPEIVIKLLKGAAPLIWYKDVKRAHLGLLIHVALLGLLLTFFQIHRILTYQLTLLYKFKMSRWLFKLLLHCDMCSQNFETAYVTFSLSSYSYVIITGMMG